MTTVEGSRENDGDSLLLLGPERVVITGSNLKYIIKENIFIYKFF
jgi:hypothetical protein